MEPLHTSREPDWLKQDPSTWNRWQRIAAKTNGWLTPGNVISVTGAAVSLGGLYLVHKGKTKAGLAAITVGRALDIVDGKVAHATSTKSPTGEAVDVALDKLLAAAAAYVAYKDELVSEELLLLLGGGQVANMVLTGIAKAQHNEIHPGVGGKYGQFDMWASLFCNVAAKKTEGLVSETFQAIGDIATGGYAYHEGLALVADYIPAAFLHQGGQNADAALAVEHIDD